MKYYFSFDVETVGLYGPPFAYGWCVVDEDGYEHAHDMSWYLHPYLEFGLGKSGVAKNQTYVTTQDDVEWVNKNIKFPVIAQVSNQNVLLDSFWNSWASCCKEFSALTMVTDCPYPVESNFLRQAILIPYASTQKSLMDVSPYPVIDVASVLLAKGWNPLGTYNRLPNKQPAHDPLNDARQSVRLMLEALGRIGPDTEIVPVEKK